MTSLSANRSCRAGQRSVQPVGQDLVGVLPGRTRWTVDLCWSAREPGCRGWLGDAVVDEKGSAGGQLGVAGRIGHSEHWRHAGVAVGEYLCPFLLGAGCEGRAD